MRARDRIYKGIYTLPLRVRSLFRRRVEEELDEELAHHLELRANEYVSKGLDQIERSATTCAK